MKHMGESRMGLDLRELVVEASQALACLDAERLEDLALSCHTFNRCLEAGNPAERAAQAVVAGELVHEMAVFARVMEATRANRNVMRRLRDLYAGRLEYGQRPGPKWTIPENAYGDH